MNLATAYFKVLDSHNEIYRSLMADLSSQQQSIVSLLADERCAITVKTIAKKLFISHQTTSSQLGTLLKKGIVEKETVGRESYYEIADVRFRHWLDMKARRRDRIINYVNFVEQH